MMVLALGGGYLAWNLGLRDLLVTADPEDQPGRRAERVERTVEEIAEQALPAVVSIETSRGRGLGFFAAPGLIVTSHTLVAGYVAVPVKLAGGSSTTAWVDLVDEAKDLALLRPVDSKAGQATLTLSAPSETLRGQQVVAVVSTLEANGSTVTAGVAEGIVVDGGGVRLVRTDVAVNLASIGGPLLDRTGQVLGIHTVKLGRGQGGGLAVAADHARALLARGGAPASAEERAAATRERQWKEGEGRFRFRDAVEILWKKALALDNLWYQGERRCLGRTKRPFGAPVSRTERDWYGVLREPLVASAGERPECRLWIDEVNRRVDDIRVKMDEAEAEAERAGVPFADRLEIRRGFNVDW